ncbi:TetR family transcriptional regulator [Nocardia tenerifensis]|uniref:TetR family transcriptional regulator n=1 Tax=Nocardia tenerifensis TaxID=228006 RepID=A0A318KER7_9NOCA|nr:TetR family transcriptional regulator [Nocardia tenerifensis]
MPDCYRAEVGTREDLLAAAKRCLAERGYARTTVRDIVAASGTNLAAINYHFGTRDKLLSQAMMESSSTAVQAILESLPAEDTDPAVRLRAFLERLIGSFTEERLLWSANIESFVQALHSPELRAELGAAQSEAREALAHVMDGAAPDPAVGAVLQTMIGGLLIQWLIDPDNAPSAATIAAGLRTLAEAVDPA